MASKPCAQLQKDGRFSGLNHPDDPEFCRALIGFRCSALRKRRRVPCLDRMQPCKQLKASVAAAIKPSAGRGGAQEEIAALIQTEQTNSWRAAKLTATVLTFLPGSSPLLSVFLSGVVSHAPTLPVLQILPLFTPRPWGTGVLGLQCVCSQVTHYWSSLSTWQLQN